MKEKTNLLMIGGEDFQQNSEGEINTPDVIGEAGPSLVGNGISILSCPLYSPEPLGGSMIKGTGTFISFWLCFYLGTSNS